MKLTYEQWAEKALADGWRPPLHAHITKGMVEEFAGEEAELIPGNQKKYWLTKSGKIISCAFGRLKEYKIQYAGPYPFVSVATGKNIYLHRVMAQLFIPNPDKLPVVNHKNGNKHDFSLDNLEWCTPKENTQHAMRLGLRRSRVQAV